MVKSKINKMICVLMACVLFAVALFHPDEAKAEESTEYYYSEVVGDSGEYIDKSADIASLQSVLVVVNSSANVAQTSYNGFPDVAYILKGSRVTVRIEMSLAKCLKAGIYDVSGFIHQYSSYFEPISFSLELYSSVSNKIYRANGFQNDFGKYAPYWDNVEFTGKEYGLSLIFNFNASSNIYLSLNDLRLTFTPMSGEESAIRDLEDSLTNPDSADKNKTDEFGDKVGSQSSELDELVGDMDSVSKVDPDDIDVDVGDYISDEAIENYGMLLSVFTKNDIVFAYLIVVVSIGLVAFVMFGKRT